MAEYYVLLGDVVHSRAIEDREGFQEQLEDICGRFTAGRRDDVYGNFKILKGIDEFGGVLQSLANLYEIVTAFHDGLRPHEVRIAVASGDIDVGLASADVEKMDGEAFHRATERVEELEDESMVFDLLLGVEGGVGGAGLDEDDRSRTGDADFGRADANLGRAIADEVNLLLDLRSEWTDRQREVVAVRESVDTQTAAAEELGVTQQAVSNVLAGAKWPLVHSVEERLRETLESHADGTARRDDQS